MKTKRITAVCIGLVITILLVGCHHYKTMSNQAWLENLDKGHTEFLSEPYFHELDNIYKRVKWENEKWYVFDGSSKIAAKTVINKMMKDLKNNPDALFHHKNYDRYFETFDHNIRKLNRITEEMHYFRNTLNAYSGAPESLEDMITLASEHKWKLFSAKFHRYNYEGINSAYNVKFISANGRFEAVYNTETAAIVTDPVNMGTYNYAPGSLNPIKYYKHNLYDLIPWKTWGNVDGVSYTDIINLESTHGTAEQKTNTKNVEQWIANKAN